MEPIRMSRLSSSPATRRGRTILAAALIALGSPSAAHAEEANPILGRWATSGFGSIVEIEVCEEAGETYCGTIRWLWEDKGKDGRARRDEKNPDPALRDRPLVGVELLRDLREEEPGVFTGGKVYNPDDGRTYSGSVRLEGEALILKGCALGLFCQSQTWRRPEDVLAAAGVGRP